MPLLYDRLQIKIESDVERPVCRGCSGRVESKGRPSLTLTDLTCFGQGVDLVWRKRRWKCVSVTCPLKTWTEDLPVIALPRSTMTTRAAKWATVEVGRFARAVSDVATALGCHWHTIDTAVCRWGEALLDADTDRIAATDAVGLDEVLQVRVGEFRAKQWATSIVDVRSGKLLDLVEGRSARHLMQRTRVRHRASLAHHNVIIAEPGELNQTGTFSVLGNHEPE
jgi:hypothetical protein